jgi:hypothetical protein
LDKSLRGARHFYAVLIVSILLGLTLDFLKVNPADRFDTARAHPGFSQGKSGKGLVLDCCD